MFPGQSVIRMFTFLRSFSVFYEPPCTVQCQLYSSVYIVRTYERILNDDYNEITVLNSCKQDRSLSIEWFDTFVSLGFVNLSINPLIYAARYEVFRKSLRRMFKKDNVASAIAMPTL